jgi:hypothetical protein
LETQEAIACSVPSKAPSPYQGKFFKLMVISLIINYTSGPLPDVLGRVRVGFFFSDRHLFPYY